MAQGPLKIDDQTRVYVRVAMRDTLSAYDLADLLDVMAGICQDNADVGPAGALGLSAVEWRLRADVLRQAADRLQGAGDEV
jgi:hypothetical protein